MTYAKLWVKLTKIEKKLDKLLSEKQIDNTNNLKKMNAKIDQINLEVKRISKKIK
jgi:hypothetical protein